MKTPRIQNSCSEESVRVAQKLARTQTKSQRAINGAGQPIVSKVEPEVVDINYFKNKWNNLVKFFRGK